MIIVSTPNANTTAAYPYLIILLYLKIIVLFTTSVLLWHYLIRYWIVARCTAGCRPGWTRLSCLGILGNGVRSYWSMWMGWGW